jgi:hypothetical protein
MSRRWSVLLIFGLWTLLIWGTRIDNIWADAELATGAKWWRTALAASFVIAGVAVLVTTWRLRRAQTTGSDSVIRMVVGIAATWTTVVWIIRALAIAIGDHDMAFIVVHLVLAVVSIGLAAWALVTVRRPNPVAVVPSADTTPIAH